MEQSNPESSEFRPARVVKAYMHSRLGFEDATGSRAPNAGGSSASASIVRHSNAIATVSGSENPAVVEEEDFSLQDVYRDAEVARKRFEEAMTLYESNAPEKYKTGVLQAGSTHTWDQVLEQVHLAAEAYNDDSTRWGKIRKRFRSIGKNSSAFKSWLGLLPASNDYISIVCGGLKLIIGAAGKLHDLREGICEALEDIPFQLKVIQFDLGTFKSSKELHQRCASLFAAIFAALDHVLDWYSRKAIKRYMASMFKQEAYEMELTEKLKAIEIESNRFRHVAEAYARRVQMKSNQDINALRDENRNSQLWIAHGVNRLQSAQDGTNEEIGKLRAELEDLRRGLVESHAQFLASQSRLNYTTQDDRGPMLPWRKPGHISEIDLTPLEPVIAAASRSLFSNVNLYRTLALPEKNRANSILAEAKLQSWLSLPQSSSLFINGNGTAASARGSATSFVAAQLAAAVINARMEHPNDAPEPTTEVIKFGTTSSSAPKLPPRAIYYFCGTQTGTNPPNVATMLKSLLAQLICAYDLAPRPKLVAKIADPAQSNALKFCDIFTGLITQLPRGSIVFCILDCITQFEHRGYRDPYDTTATSAEDSDAEIVVNELVDLSERLKEWDDGPVLKLLLTCPWESRRLWKCIGGEREKVIWMPNKLIKEEDWTERGWRAAVERALRERAPE